MPPLLVWLPLFLADCGGTNGSSQGQNPDANNILIPKEVSDLAMDSAACIGCGACVAACNQSAGQVSYARDVAPVLAGCSGEVCHAPWDRGTLVNQPSHSCCDRRLLVDPYHPSFSLLTQALTGIDSCVGTMPQGGHLAAPAIQAMTAWVCQGALDN